MRYAFVFLLLSALPALARVGGGESYSGGGSSYSSSGSSGGGGGDGIGLIIELFIRLIFYYPQIGIPLLIGAAIWYFYQQKLNANSKAFSDLKNWSASNTVQRHPRPDLGQLKNQDPNFSETLFLDFLTSLYTRTLLGAGGSLANIGAYLSPGVRERMEQSAQKVDGVIIGALRIKSVNAGSKAESVEVQLESNLSFADGAQVYVVDEMTLQRDAGTKTPKPETVYSLSCPYCGNNSAISEEGRCPSCDQIVNDGKSSWVLLSFYRRNSTTKSPVVLSDGGEELGTDLPTVYSPTLSADLHQLRERDPSFDDQKFKELAAQTFLLLQDAWTNLQWEKARPLETDYLFQQHQYWMNSYQKDGVRNVLEDVKINKIDLAKVSIDRYFDGITVRIFSSMKDYTIILASGQVVSGFPNKTRTFSEYWTFVRRSGVTSKERDATRCPHCGAPLDKVTQVGDCEYCQTRITRGDFDWILSRIEQDEAYF